MTNVGILLSEAHDRIRYHAVAKGKRSEGRTPGEALDTLLANHLSDDETNSLTLVQIYARQESQAAEP
jgi:hypothetical protein